MSTKPPPPVSWKAVLVPQSESKIHYHRQKHSMVQLQLHKQKHQQAQLLLHRQKHAMCNCHSTNRGTAKVQLLYLRQQHW